MILTVVDHASNVVPTGIELGIAPDLLETHIAWDIGAAALARALGYPAHLARVSRLVVDCNREEDAAGLVPVESDGVAIPGNDFARQSRRPHPLAPAGASRSLPEREDWAERLRYYHEYHDALAARIERERPAMLLSLHSFTPRLRDGEPRPWEVGVLYNEDERAARAALPLLTAAGVVAGDQLPYSGKLLNATMNRHGEGNGLPYLGLEVRQDLIADEGGVARWAAVLRPVVDTVARHFVAPA